MEGIKFKIKQTPVWVKGDHSDFDETEIGIFSKEERTKVEFLVNPLTVNERRIIEKKYTSSTKVGDEVKDVQDDAAIRKEFMERMVADWKGLISEEKNEPILCTNENKIALLDGGYPKLALVLLKISFEITKYTEKYQAEQIKN